MDCENKLDQGPAAKSISFFYLERKEKNKQRERVRETKKGRECDRERRE